jgi:hypothetical protein
LLRQQQCGFARRVGGHSIGRRKMPFRAKRHGTTQ